MYNFNRVVYVYGELSNIVEMLDEYRLGVNTYRDNIELDLVSYADLEEINLHYYNEVCSEVDLGSDFSGRVVYVDSADPLDVIEVIRELLYGDSYLRFESSEMYLLAGLDYDVIDLTYEDYIDYRNGDLKLYSLGSFQVLIEGLLRERVEYGNFDDYIEVVDLYDKLHEDDLLTPGIEDIYNTYIDAYSEYVG